MPCCPELTEILHEHLRNGGTAADRRLFWGERSQGRLGSSVYGRVWASARGAVFILEVFLSTLAKPLRPSARVHVELAYGGCRADQGCRVGRAQSCGAAPRVRQVRRRRYCARAPADRRVVQHWAGQGLTCRDGWPPGVGHITPNKPWRSGAAGATPKRVLLSDERRHSWCDSICFA